MAETSAWRKLCALGGAALVLTCMTSARAQVRGADPYGKWWTTCDNTHACSVYGTGGGDGVAVTVIIRREPDPQAPVRVTLVADDPRATAGGAAWRVFIDDHPIVAARARSGKVMLAELNGPDALTLVTRLLSAREMRLEGPGAGGALGATGAAAALRQMDEEQGRSGGVTAIAARGVRPATAVPRAPTPPVIEIGSLPTQVNLPSDSPLGRLDRRRCKSGKEPLGDPKVYRLNEDTLLWLAPCGKSDRGQALVLLSNAKGGKIRAALGGKGKGEQVEAQFDARRAVLTAFESEHGLTDCGKGVDYVWTGDEFQIVREREMSQCVGLPRELWPDTFRAVVRRPS